LVEKREVKKMTDKIPIPSSIADVTPDLCRRVFEEICGGWVGWYAGMSFWHFPDKSIQSPPHTFNPFTRIQDTKLLDKWVVGNGLGMVVVLRKATKLLESDETRYVFDVQIGSTKKRKINFTTVRHTAKTEEMARACAIIDAYNKLKEES